jgi:hypothetical protein
LRGIWKTNYRDLPLVKLSMESAYGIAAGEICNEIDIMDFLFFCCNCQSWIPLDIGRTNLLILTRKLADIVI